MSTDLQPDLNRTGTGSELSGKQDRADGSRLVSVCKAISESTAFTVFIVSVILANAAILGVATYPSIVESSGALIANIEHVFVGIFVVELAIRIAAYGRRPRDFFRDGWNVFDFIVVAAALIPGMGANSAVLRLVRILRVLRLVRLFPSLRTILTAIAHSLPGVVGFLGLAVLMLYVYGMVGWLLFAETMPDDFGTIGASVLTLFVLLSMESLPDMITAGLAVGSWTLLYFVSYVLVASYLLVNVLVGVVINSMMEARQLLMTDRLRPDFDEDGDGIPDEIDRIVVAQRLDELRAAIAGLERELRGEPTKDSPHRDHARKEAANNDVEPPRQRPDA